MNGGNVSCCMNMAILDDSLLTLSPVVACPGSLWG